MAAIETTSVTTDESELFDLVAKEIKKTFDQLIDQLTERRDALLKEIEDNKEKNITRESTRIAALEELITTQQHLEGLSLRVNVNREFHNQNKELYRQRIEQLSVPTKLHPPFFSCQTLYQLQTLVAEFGEVRECVMEYSLKKQPVIAVGKRGKGNNELDDSAGVALDASNQLIYVADCANRRIQVVSMSEEFIKRFGQETFKRPYDVAVTGDSVFVTDIGLHALFQFGKSDYQLVRRTDSKGAEGGQLNNPRGLCVDFNGDVCVADSWNNSLRLLERATIREMHRDRKALHPSRREGDSQWTGGVRQGIRGYPLLLEEWRPPKLLYHPVGHRLVLLSRHSWEYSSVRQNLRRYQTPLSHWTAD